MNYQEIADLASEKLDSDKSWEKRYSVYVEDMIKNEKYVTAVCNCFKPKAPLTKYLSIGRVKKAKLNVDIDLRIMGTSVATISVKSRRDQELRERAEKGEKDENLAKDFQAAAEVTFNNAGLNKVKSKLPEEAQGELDEIIPNPLNKGNNSFKWNSDELKKFRSLMKAQHDNDKIDISDEHMFETLLLKGLSKKGSNGKYLCHIQPCKICGQYYQLVTPLAASNAKKDKIGISQKGGGIDILARCKRGNNTTLCVIELKDEYKKDESPGMAIKQAIAYATFIIKLIRSKDADGARWYKDIMGINKELTPDKPIKVYAVVAMPYKNDSAELPPEDTDFIKEGPVKVGNDEIHLHYIYFKEDALKNPKIPKGFTCSFIKSQD